MKRRREGDELSGKEKIFFLVIVTDLLVQDSNLAN
jgi:hypothetical protein